MDKFTQVQIETRDILSRLVDKKQGEVSSSGSHQGEKKVFKEQILFKTGPHNRPLEFKEMPMSNMPKFLEHRVEEVEVPFEGVIPIEVWLTEYMAFSEEFKIHLNFRYYYDYQERVKYIGGNKMTPQNFDL